MARRWRPKISVQAAAARDVAGSGSPSPALHDLHALQRLAGNQAVSRIMRDATTNPVGVAGGAVHPEVRRALAATVGRGRGLDSESTASARRVLGPRVDDVQVHHDPTADVLCRSLGARAFTLGQDIFFSRGSFEPGSAGGRRLLGHELTHVAQQPVRRSNVPAALEVGAVDAAEERVAERRADHVAAALAGGDSPVGGELAPAAGEGAGVIRRSVGFEFQTQWGVTKLLDNDPFGISKGRRVKNDNKMDTRYVKLPKGSVLTKVAGGKVKMTADEASSTQLGAEIEWVLDPPLPDDMDFQQVETIADEFAKYVSEMLQHAEKDSFLLSELTKKGADARIEIQPGIKGDDKRDMGAAPQVTGGVRPEHLVTVFNDIIYGGNDKKRRSEDSSTANKFLKGRTPAEGMMGALRSDKLPEGVSPELKGLLALIYRYLIMGKDKNVLSYAKVNTQFLMRTDFATLFSKLPDRELRAYGGAKYQDGDKSKADAFVELVQKVTDVSPKRRVYPNGIGDKDKPTSIDVTAGEWVRGLAEGEDRLSGAFWRAQNSVPKKKSKRSKVLSEELESMGSLGDKVDKVGPTQKDAGIILEFRSNTDRMPPEVWPEYIKAVFKYFHAVNQLDRPN